MVNYTAVLNASDATGAAADADAAAMYLAMERVLVRFDCTLRYSMWDCSACRDAYRFWACGVKFPQCGPGGVHTKCATVPQCAHGRRRVCRSICEDVVRKCPYTLDFTCPREDTVDYDGDVATCNKLNRTVFPDGTSNPWPGTFSAGAAPVAAWAVVAVALVSRGAAIA